MAIEDHLMIALQSFGYVLQQHTKHTVYELRDYIYEIYSILWKDETLPVCVRESLFSIYYGLNGVRDAFKDEAMLAINTAYGYALGVYECHYGAINV